MISIIDYGVGNVASILNILRKIGAKATLCNTEEGLRNSSKIILPGIGNFGHGMNKLAESGLVPCLNELVLKEKKPVLGICLGMQMMTRGSAEAASPGLGWVNGETVRFPDLPSLRIPHMGWNTVNRENASTLFDADTSMEERFYFVHSYYVKMDNDAEVAASCDYGLRFAASFECGNLFGVQFHPEKSHQYGMALFRRFHAL